MSLAIMSGRVAAYKLFTKATTCLRYVSVGERQEFPLLSYFTFVVHNSESCNAHDLTTPRRQTRRAHLFFHLQACDRDVVCSKD